MFDVSLATQPSAVVTVTVGSGDTGGDGERYQFGVHYW